MKEKTLEILCCPLCMGELDLINPEKYGESIVSGILKCKKCGKEYRIRKGIPDLVP